jgi:hypothetical protein
LFNFTRQACLSVIGKIDGSSHLTPAGLTCRHRPIPI